MRGWLMQRGFARQRSLERMVREPKTGSTWSQPKGEWQRAIAGPELG
jgi:hypothetical protein